MKRMLTAIVALIMSVTTINAQRLANINVEAQYITDKMVVELGLSSVQRNSILQLNLNYLNGISSYRDINSRIWKTRNERLKSILSASQWRLYKDAHYFYRPIGWKNGAYVHNIYAKYPKACKAKGNKYGKTKGDKYGKRDKFNKNNNSRHSPNKRGSANRRNESRREAQRQNTFGSRR